MVDRKILARDRWNVRRVVQNFMGVVILAISAHIIDDQQKFGMVGDVDPYVEAVEREEVVHDGLDCAVSDALSCVGHDAEDQGAYALQGIVEFGTQIFDGLDHRDLVGPLRIRIV